MRTLIVISVALLLAVACLPAANAKPHTQPVDPEGRKPSDSAAAIIPGGSRRLLETKVDVSSPKTEEKDDGHRCFVDVKDNQPRRC